MAGILLVVFPTVIYGSVSLLGLLIDGSPGYVDNPIRRSLWRAGHAHAGILLILALLLLRYLDEARLPRPLVVAVRYATALAAVLVPAAFFLSVASPVAQKPNSLIYLAYAGAVVLTLAMVTLGIGLLRAGRDER